MFRRLRDDRCHCLLDAQGCLQRDKIRCHSGTDQLFIIGRQSLKLRPRLRIHEFKLILVKIFQLIADHLR